MNLYINGRFLTQNVTGVQRYATEIVKSIDDLLIEGSFNQIKEITILVPNQTFRNYNFKKIKVKKVGHLKGHLWEQIDLPRYTKDDYLINLCNTAPMFKKKQIVTIHDVAFLTHPEGFSLIFKIWYKILFRNILKFAKYPITISNFSLIEINNFFNINKRIRVIYEGKEHFQKIKSDINILKKNNLETNSYILAVSSLNPNKNFQGIINAINFLPNIDVDIVIAGGSNTKVFKQLDINEKFEIKKLGYVSDSELKALYENATVFLYPSLYEGFGLPPLEAMSCGCPVIVSEVASLPEICEDAALYCNPYSPKDIAEKIEQVINNKDLRKLLSEKGLKRVEFFSWKKCASEIMSILKQEH